MVNTLRGDCGALQVDEGAELVLEFEGFLEGVVPVGGVADPEGEDAQGFNDSRLGDVLKVV